MTLNHIRVVVGADPGLAQQVIDFIDAYQFRGKWRGLSIPLDGPGLQFWVGIEIASR
jgi:hypothetical protein